MNPISILGFLKDVDPLTAVILTLVIVLGISQGWIVVRGLQFKKKAEKKPAQCLRGRAGSCELVRLQMEQAEEIIQRVKAKAISLYLSKRKEILGTKDGLYRDREVHHYSAILYQVEQRIKDDIRNFFRKNHLVEMTEDEFNAHAKKRVDIIVSKLTEYLDQMYYPDANPDRIALYDINHERLLPDVKNGIIEAFQGARKLSVEFEDGKLDPHLIREGVV